MRAETAAAIRAVSMAIDIADRRVGADEVSSKGGIDLVTATDVAGEDIIRKVLTDSFPDTVVVGEERGGVPEAGKPYWLVDPICGTRPFASDVPLYCTNIALAEDNRVTVAAVALGRCGEILHAERGKGAWLRKNGTDIPVSPASGSNTLWVGGRGELVANITRAVMLDRRWYVWQFSSSIAYAYLAAGRIAGLIHIAPHLSSVHTAAGCFIAEEAGARVYDFERNRDWDLDTRSYLLSATPELHESLLQIVQECREQR